MSKVTVEDQSGRIQYSDGWVQNGVCVACDTSVDKIIQVASGGTWMQTWWADNTRVVTATMEFEGTGVDAYFLFFWRSQDPNSTGEGNLFFFVDDKLEMQKPVVASDYQFTADIAPRTLVFSKSGYSAAKHTLRIQWTNNGPRPRVAVGLDRIDYTPLPAPAPAPAPGSSTTTSATSTAASPTATANTSATGGKPSDTSTQTSSSRSTSTSGPAATGLSDAAGPPNSGGSDSSSNGGNGDSRDPNGISAGANSNGDQVSGSSNNTGKIVGPVVAVVVLLALLVGGLLIWRRRRRRARVNEYLNNTPADPFVPTTHAASPFNQAVAPNAPNIYMTNSHYAQTPVSQVPQPQPWSTVQQQPAYQPGHQRTLSPDSNSQYSWNAASAYTGYTGASAGSNPFSTSSGEATQEAAAAAASAYSPPPYAAAPGQTVGASGTEKRRVVS